MYQKYLHLTKSKEKDEWVTLCPFHEEKTPSFYVNEKKGFFYCQGCGRGGGPKQFLRLLGKEGDGDEYKEILKQVRTEEPIKFTEPISSAVIERLHQNLLEDTSKLSYLINTRKISYFTIKKFVLGFDTSTGRYAVPIRSKSGKFINVKLHNSDLVPKSFYWQDGSTVKLFPFSSLLRTDIVLCEGEFDCLVLHSLGINAVTSTSGASSWSPNWNVLFIDKTVKVIYDTDNAGKSGALKVKEELNKVTERVQIIELPHESGIKEDVTSFIQKGGNIFKILKMKRKK